MNKNNKMNLTNPENVISFVAFKSREDAGTMIYFVTMDHTLTGYVKGLVRLGQNYHLCQSSSVLGDKFYPEIAVLKLPRSANGP